MANAIDIVVNATDKASGKLDNVGKKFDTLTSKAKKASGLIMGAMTAGATAIAGIVYAGAKQNAMLETSESRWTTLLKSHDKAIDQMKWLQDFAKSSPFDYQGLDEASTSMNGMGIELEKIHAWLPVLGDVAGVLGGGTETVKGISIALGQMNAKGKVSAEEMMQLAERGVNAWGFLADGMGLSVAEVQKLSSEGKILAEDALPHIIKGMEGAFGGGMQTYMQSTVGQAQQAQEAFQQLSGQLTQGVYNWFGATILPMINDGLQALSDTFSGGLMSGFQELWNNSTMAKVAITLLAGVITGLLIGAFFLIAPAVTSAVVAFAPFLAIGMAVAGLALIIMNYWEPIKAWFINTFGGLASAFSNFFTGIWNTIQPILSMVVSFIQEKLNQIKQFWAENGQMILQAVQNVWSFISGFISTTLNVILAIFNFIFPAIKFLVLGVWEGIKNIIDGALKFIMGIIQVFAGLLTGNWSKVWEGVKNVLNGAIQFIWGIFSTFFAGKLLGVVSKFGGQVVKFLGNMASKAGSAISKFASNVASKFSGMVSKVISIVKNWVSSVISAVDNFVYKILSKVTKVNADVGIAFARGWEAIKGFIKSGIQGAIGVIKGMFSTFKSAGKGLLDALTKGIKDGIGKAVGAVKEGVGKIRNLLPFSPAKEGPLSDLDKSGKSFFPTFAQGLVKGVNPMLSMAEKGMSQLNGVLAEPAERMEQLDSFSFGKAKTVMRVEIAVSGDVGVNGDKTRYNDREVVDNVTGDMNDLLRDLRQAIRKR